MAKRYLLDTDICVYFRKGRPEVRARLETQAAGEAAISVITYGELAFGAERSTERLRAFAGLQTMTKLLSVLPLPSDAGIFYASIRSALAAAGNIVGPNDLWIAAHALAANLTLVTNNEREFRRVEGLKIENWTK